MVNSHRQTKGRGEEQELQTTWFIQRMAEMFPLSGEKKRFPATAEITG